MSQNSGQNIDDILQQLKSKVSAEETSEESLNVADIYVSTPSDSDFMSDAELQSQLKNQFINNDEKEIESEDEYKLDTDFLNEAQNGDDTLYEQEEPLEEEILETDHDTVFEDETAVGDEEIEEIIEDIENHEENKNIESSSEEKISYEYYQTLKDEDIKLIMDDSKESEEAIWKDPSEEQEDEENDLAAEDVYSDESGAESLDVAASDEEAKTTEEIADESDSSSSYIDENKRSFISVLKETSAQKLDDSEENSTVDESLETIEKSEIENEDNGNASHDAEKNSDNEEEEDFLNDYFTDMIFEKPVEEEVSEEELFEIENKNISDVAESVLSEEEREITSEEAENELLLQLGYDVLDSVKKIKPFEPERKERIRQSYARKRKSMWLSYAGSLAIMLVLFFYELLPAKGYDFAIIINAEEYPVAYMLIGFQLFIAAAALFWKKLWMGAKNLAAASPDHNSVILITSVFTVIYDLVVAISNYNSIPPMFNFLAVFAINISVAVDIIMLHCEMKSFSIYFSNEVKYTSVTDKRLSSVAEKMYRGGLAPSQNVYVPAEFSPTSSFFRSLDNSGETKKSMYAVSIPVVAAALILWVCGIILEKDAVMSISIAMTALFAVLPIAVVFADVLPIIIMNIRLHKRDIVVSGIGTAKKFAKCNIMVFKDIHFFEKCIPQNAGMIFYDEANAQLVFKCLNAIYSEIDSPMSDVFSGISKNEEYDVRFIRLISNGIEAIVDHKYSVLVGTAEFMDRYGIEFQKTESEMSGIDAEPLCVAINGKATAKISVKYKAVGIFEMIVEKLAKEGVYCAIETYDPLINSVLVNRARIFGKTPISVVHLNFNDYAREKYDKKTENIALVSGENIGICANRSRLKLAEALIWCKRIIDLRRGNAAIVWIGSIVGIILPAIGYFVPQFPKVDQFTILAFQAVLCAFIFMVATLSLPKRDYFKFERFREKMLVKQEKQNQKNEKKAAREMISEHKNQLKNQKKSEKKQKKI